MDKKAFVGLDVHKDSLSISIAEEGRNDPVRFLGVIPNSAEAVTKMAKRLSKHGQLDFCYEAGGCGYGIYRQLTFTWSLLHSGCAVTNSAKGW